MTGFSVCSISCFFSCIFVSSFLLNTLVSLPLPRPDQVDILLAFKSEFSSTTCHMPDPATKSWTKDAITFDGVVFDNETGFVTELDLGVGCLSGTLKSNSSLFRFQHLRYLDLSFNDFSSSPFLAEFGKFTNLEVLYLGYNGMVGEVSSSISNLRRLTRLDLSANEFIGSIPFIYNITKLSFIDLSVNHFSGTIPSSLFTMPFLSSLNLRQNHLKDPVQTMNLSSSSKLKKLFLSKNLLSGEILEAISKLVSLTHLDLSFNDFSSSPFPYEFGKLPNLELLDIQGNSFIGIVPHSMSNLSHLTDLDLSNNKFIGSFPFVHHLTKLSTLNLSCNHFSGPIPSSLLTMSSSLSNLDLSGNYFNDPLRYMNSSSSSSNLQELHLADNLFSGKILELVLNLVNLTYLDMSFLNITFPINFSLFPLKSLEVLDISGNNISYPSSILDDSLSTELTELRFSGCNINEFPKFLKKLQNLVELDISNNNIKGKVPEWLWNLPFLTDVSLSHNSFDGFEGPQEVILNSPVQSLELDSNSFEGSLPTLPPSVMYLYASNNKFNGVIPLTLCNATLLRLLDLSNNNFSGSVPRCFKDSLEVLNLYNNSLSGRISDSFNRGYPLLTTIDVGHNQISGKLPRSLVNCTSLETLNVESNGIIDTFPFWLKTLPNLQVIVLRSNKFHGPISSPQDPLSFLTLRIIDISRNSFTGTLPTTYFANWSAALVNMREVYRLPEYMTNQFLGGYQPSIYLKEKGLNMELSKIPITYTVIDFSGNRFGGTIPKSIGLLKQLVVLDLSNNGFIGHIPSSLAKLTKLESLDLSRNQLSGEIPQELAILTFLGYIDVSHNKLKGQIPQCTQFGGQPKSSFEENVDLCGLPLQKSCFEENGSPTPKSESPEKEHLLNWKAAAISYGPGVLIGLAIGQVLASYKPVLYYKLFRL